MPIMAVIPPAVPSFNIDIEIEPERWCIGEKGKIFVTFSSNGGKVDPQGPVFLIQAPGLPSASRSATKVPTGLYYLDYTPTVTGEYIVTVGATYGGFSLTKEKKFETIECEPTEEPMYPWPDGNTLYNGNQTRLGGIPSSRASSLATRLPRRVTSPQLQTLFSQVIVSADDVGFDGNQSECRNSEPLIANTLLAGVTLRASDNRFKEVRDKAKWSLLTCGFMNNTSNNQGDHCIFPLPLGNKTYSTGNQALYREEEFCGDLSKQLVKLTNLFEEQPGYLQLIGYIQGLLGGYIQLMLGKSDE